MASCLSQARGHTIRSTERSRSANDGLNVTYNSGVLVPTASAFLVTVLMNYAIAIDFLKDSDPILGQLIDQIGACQLNQHELEGDLFFCLSRSILHQQLSTKVAKVIHARFLQLYPDTQFPSAQDVLNTPDEVLRNVGISRPKISYLKDLARHAIEGLPTLEELEVMDDEAIIKTLTRVKGIGRWTVQMLLIFRLKRWDVLPVDDLGVRAGIRKLYGLEALPDRKTTERFGDKWKPYCSIASWYLWRSLEPLPQPV